MRKFFWFFLMLLLLPAFVSAEPRPIPMSQVPSRDTGEKLVLGQPTDGSKIAEVHVWHKSHKKASIYDNPGEAICPEGDWFNFRDNRGFWQLVDADSPTGPGVRTKCDYHPPSNPDETWCAYWCLSGASKELMLQPGKSLTPAKKKGGKK